MDGNILDLVSDPLFGISLTVIVYALLAKLRQIYPWINIMFFSVVIIIGVLFLFNIPYDAYEQGGEMITFMLGPATIALGVPLYKEGQNITSNAHILLGGITIGSLIAIVSAIGLTWLFIGTDEIMLSMIPKSATTPISIVIADNLGGSQGLAASFTALTGVFGALSGPEIMKKVGIHHDLAIGSALGTSSHGLGTARAITTSRLQGSVSGFSMALTGIITSLLVIPLYWIF